MANLAQIMELDKQYYMNTFGLRKPVAFERGEGLYLYDTEENKYTDMFAGIAVSALGHCHPDLVAAVKAQADKLFHTSSLYYIENQAKLAQKIVQNSCTDRVFLANSGAEANEGAMKLAKIYFHKQGRPDKKEIITLDHSFHGRTLATVAATGQEKYQQPYRPLTPGFHHAKLGDFNDLLAKVNENTAAIMLEVIQGESGVRPCEETYLKQVRALCDEKEILLIIDEVQTAMGRCGTLFGYQLFGIEPDIITMAKALGGGLPIGAVAAKEFVAAGFEPGDHGTTFGGNPFVTAAALCVFDVMERDNIVQNAGQMGEYFYQKLADLQGQYPAIKEIRGAGLMIGVELKETCGKTVCDKLFEQRILTGCVGDTLRILPPLIITTAQIDEFIAALEGILKQI